MDIKAHAQVLLRKWVSNTLMDPTMEWARLFLLLLEDFTWEQRRSINKARYSPLDRILLNTVRTCRSMTYTSKIWKAWAA